jgi:hypothetical protein
MAAHISGYRKNSRRVRNTPLFYIVLLVMHAGHYVNRRGGNKGFLLFEAI